MTSRLDRLVGKLVTLREGEAATALLMFAYSFLAMTSYNILKPITRSKFITALGADNLPYVQLAAGVIIGVLIQGYSGATGRLPRRWVIPVTQAGEVALLVLLWALFQAGGDWVSVAFYVLGLVLGILLISQFWMLANDIYDPRQARRRRRDSDCEAPADHGRPGGGRSVARELPPPTCSFFSRARCSCLAGTVRRVTSPRPPRSPSKRCSKAVRSATRFERVIAQ